MASQVSTVSRGHERRGSVQKTQEKEKHRPVILLMSARVSTKSASKNDGHHVYNDRDPFASRKCVRHKEPRFKPFAVSVLFLLPWNVPPPPLCRRGKTSDCTLASRISCAAGENGWRELQWRNGYRQECRHDRRRVHRCRSPKPYRE